MGKIQCFISCENLILMWYKLTYIVHPQIYNHHPDRMGKAAFLHVLDVWTKHEPVQKQYLIIIIHHLWSICMNKMLNYYWFLNSNLFLNNHLNFWEVYTKMLNTWRSANWSSFCLGITSLTIALWRVGWPPHLWVWYTAHFMPNNVASSSCNQ